MAEGSGRTWLKYGCLGCAAVIGLVALLAGTLAAVATLKARGEDVEDRAITRDVPSVEAPSLDPSMRIDLPVKATGRMVLDLADAEVEIEPGRPGEPVRIETSYDTGDHELVESFTPDEGNGWLYEVRFRRSGSMLVNALREMFGGTRPELRITVPPDVPMELVLAMAQGGAQVELGGLWLTSAEVRFDKGGLQLSISDPLPAPMERFTIRATMCGIDAEGLGNASPRELDVEVSMGGMDLDLRGEWVRDADVKIDSRMSGTMVRLPRGVRIQGLDSSGPAPSVEPEIPLPTLTFSIFTDDRGDFRTVF